MKNTFTTISLVKYWHHGSTKFAHKINYHRNEKAVWCDRRNAGPAD